jgi:uncharacterized membrane protein YkvA (DUF1232 family)
MSQEVRRMPARRFNPDRYAHPTLLGAIVEQVRLAWRLLLDPRVPAGLKLLIPALVALYAFSPLDLVPDFLLGFGQLDDLGIVLAALALFARLAPRAVVAEHRAAMAGQPAPGGGGGNRDEAIDVDYTVGGRRTGATGQ